MKYPIIPVLLAGAAVCVAMPAFAAVPVWQFDAPKNQLDLQMDSPVQPQARLVQQSPIRVVIDLPGIRLGRPSFTEALNQKTVRSIRFGQFETNTARVVLELNPGYTIDPQQVKFQSLSARHWQVTLPNPTAIPVVPPNPANNATITTESIPDVAIAVPTLPPEQLAKEPSSGHQKGHLLVVIDPGHGGPDVGAVGIDGIQEKDIVLDISRQLADRLRAQGFDVVMTRDADIDLDLEPRVALAERLRADYFVSVHANSINMSHPEVSGLQTYYYHDNSERLAAVVHSQVLRTTGIQDRSVRTARFYVIRNTSMPAILVEVGFVTGAVDATHLADPGYRTKTAEAIAAGLTQLTH